jgi:tetratricopeptide (TPR) repeat protein
VYNKELYECWVSFPDVAEWDSLDAKALLESLEPEYHYRLAEGAYKESPALRNILEMYRRDLQESHFLFPYLGIACLERLRGLSQQGILLLTADKGDHRLDYWSGRNVPELICHGSFSLTANYHALQHFYQAKGAATYFTKHHYSHINIGCLVMLPDAPSYKETRLAYKRFIEQFGPDDYYSLKTLIDRHLETMELEHLLAYIRLSGYDALLFKQCVPRLLSLIPSSNDVEKEDLQRMIQRVWELYFPIEEKRDLAFDCGMLLCMLGDYEAALVFFQHSLDHYEEHVAVHYNRAMCYYELGEKEQAKHAVNSAIRLEPEHAGSLALLDKMQSEGE